MPFFVLMSLFGSFSFAQAPAAPLPNCHAEIEKFCPDAAALPQVMKCLGANETQISDACKQDRDRLVQIYRSGGGRGGGGLGSFGGLSGGLNMFAPPVPILVYGGTLEPESNRPVLKIKD